jgi:phospholipase C
MPFDAFTGDTIHQYFQMYQQMDCAIDQEHVSKGNPTGCLHDLQSAITTTYSIPPTGTPHDTGRRWPSSICRMVTHRSSSSWRTTTP